MESASRPIELASAIVKTFVEPQAHQMINIKGKTRETILGSMAAAGQTVSSSIFAKAMEEVFYMLEKDSFARFCDSELFQMFMQAVGADINSKIERRLETGQ